MLFPTHISNDDPVSRDPGFSPSRGLAEAALGMGRDGNAAQPTSNISVAAEFRRLLMRLSRS